MSPNGFSSYEEMLAAQLISWWNAKPTELGLNASDSGDEDSVEADAADES